MPNRILKESICRSGSIDSLSWFEEVLFYRLMVVCDDFGRFDGRVQIIKGTCFPLKDITNKDIEKALDKLSAVGLVRAYEVQGRPYLQLVTWEQHQQIRAKKSKYPEFEISCNQMISNVPVIQSNPNPIRNPIRDAREVSVAEEVEKFMRVYPLPYNQINRGMTEKEFCDCLRSGKVTEEQLIKAAENYADKLKREGKDKDYQYIKYPERFLRDLVYCQYLPGVYEPPKPVKKGYSANKGLERADYGDLSELEKELLAN